MTKDETEVQNKLKAELKAATVKNKRLQKEKRTLEMTTEAAVLASKAHCPSGTEFAPGFRAYGTAEAMKKLNDLLAKT